MFVKVEARRKPFPFTLVTESAPSLSSVTNEKQKTKKNYQRTHLREIECFRQHNNRANILLPYHSPKIVDSFFGWTLCYYISVWLEKALQRIRKSRCEGKSNIST